MRVVKQQTEPAATSPRFTQPGDQGRLVPLVCHHQISAVENATQVQGSRRVAPTSESRKAVLELPERLGAVFQNHVLSTPAVGRFVHLDLVAQVAQLAHQTPEKMRVAVVPAGHQRLIEHHDAHESTPTRCGLRLRLRYKLAYSVAAR